MKYLLILLVSFTAFARPPQCGPIGEISPARKRETVPTQLSSVGHLLMTCGYCTAWVVKKNVIITAAHCVEGKNNEVNIHMQFEDGHIIPLTPVKRGHGGASPENDDIAVLYGDTGNIVPLQLADESEWLHKQFPCMSIGYGPQGTQKATYCYGTEEDPTEPGTMVYYGSVDHGDSGGPVINAEGHVVGINKALNIFNEKILYVTPSYKILKMLKESGL